MPRTVVNQVVFALADLDPAMVRSEIIVADTADGQPLAAAQRSAAHRRARRQAAGALDPDARENRSVPPAASALATPAHPLLADCAQRLVRTLPAQDAQRLVLEGDGVQEEELELAADPRRKR
jgi:hypothetical protein